MNFRVETKSKYGSTVYGMYFIGQELQRLEKD